MNIIKIDDINDSRLDLFYRTNENQLFNINAKDRSPGLFIGESELVINRALNEGYVPTSFLIQEDEENKYIDIFKRCDKDVVIYEVKKEIFEKLKGFILIKGILATFKRKENLDYKDILKNSKRIVVLENVENPTNVGSIFRNAVGLFSDGILLTSDCSDPLYRRSIRVSMGTVFKAKYSYVGNDYINLLHEYGFKVVSFALRNNSISLNDETLQKEDKLAIVLGSEGYGLKSETIDNSDYVVKIDMLDGVDSLNVAACSAIAIYTLCKGQK